MIKTLARKIKRKVLGNHSPRVLTFQEQMQQMTSYLETIVGKVEHQPMFEALLQLSLRGMNIGGDGTTDSSGERFALEYINQKTKDEGDLVLFDVGANVGHYSYLLRMIFGDRARILAFEPSVKTFNSLITNTNELANISNYNFGFGHIDTRITLFTNADESGMASVYQRRLDHFGLQMDQKEEIEIKTVDDFCMKNNISRIHLLKLDVEGNEMNVLKGAKSMLELGAIDYIQFEFGGTNIDSRTFLQDFYYMLKENYTIYRIVGNGLSKIEHYKEIYEIFVLTNYLAERIAK